MLLLIGDAAPSSSRTTSSSASPTTSCRRRPPGSWSSSVSRSTRACCSERAYACAARPGSTTRRSGIVAAARAGLPIALGAVVYVANEDRGIPYVFLVIAGVLHALWTFVLNRTRFGRHIYAVGGNAEAARRAGINVDNGSRSPCFAICSMMAAVGGIDPRLAPALGGHERGRRLDPAVLDRGARSSAARRCSAAAARQVARSSARSSSPRSTTASACSGSARARSSSSPAACCCSRWPSTRSRAGAGANRRASVRPAGPRARSPRRPTSATALGASWRAESGLDGAASTHIVLELLDSGSRAARSSSRSARATARAARRWARESGIARAHGSYEELLADPEHRRDLHTRCPTRMHVEWSIRALEAGKHVLCEKPLARHPDGVERAFDAAPSREGRMLAEAFMWRHHPQVARARELLGRRRDRRAAAHPRALRLPRSRPRRHPPAGRRSTAAALMDVGCYCVSGCRALFAGAEPERVSAERSPAATASTSRFAATLRFPGDVLAALRLRLRLRPRGTRSRPSGAEGSLFARRPLARPRRRHRAATRRRRRRAHRARAARTPTRSSWPTSRRPSAASGRPLLGRDDAARSGPRRSRPSTRRGRKERLACPIGVEDRGPRASGPWAGWSPASSPPATSPSTADESTAEQGPPRGRRPRRPDGRLRVPLPARAHRRQPRRGPRGARRARHLLPRQRAAPRPALRQAAGSARPTTPSATRRCGVTARGVRVRRARSARTSSSGRGSRATTTRSRRPTRRSWARFIDGVGQARDALAAHGREALPRAQELRAGDEDLHAQHRDDAARHPQAARRGDRQHPGQHGLAAPAHERRAPARVRRAAGRRGAARPPARQLGLGHLRRRQHGRHHGLHGDASSSPSSCAAPATAPTASAWASTCTRTPRTRSAAVRRSVEQWHFIDEVAQRIDGGALREAQQRKDAVAAYELVYAALGAPSGVTHLLGLDVGTSSVKGIAIDEDGAVLARRRARLPAVDAAAGLERAGAGGLVARRGGVLDELDAAGRAPASGCRARCTASSRSTSSGRGRCAPRSCGTTGARRPQCERDRGAHRLRAPRRS